MESDIRSDRGDNSESNRLLTSRGPLPLPFRSTGLREDSARDDEDIPDVDGARA